MYFEYSKNDNSPIVCNLPHSSISVPKELSEGFALDDGHLKEEANYMADNYTDELYSELLHVSSFVKSNVSRIVVDIERFEDEENEPMSKVGMSALYTKTSSGDTLRTITENNKKLLKNIYDNYHATFTDLVGDVLVKNNRAIIVDCHSFPSTPRTYESDQTVDRPDICIGADTYHTPENLIEILKQNFEDLGYSVKINSPFAGSIVPLDYYRKDGRVISVMIEVNRKLYMNEETYQRSKTFGATSKSISRCIIKSLNQF